MFVQHSGSLMPISLPKYLMGASPYLPYLKATAWLGPWLSSGREACHVSLARGAVRDDWYCSVR